MASYRRFYEEDARKRRAGSELGDVHKFVLKMIEVNSDSVILEAGCGGGALLSEVARKSKLAVGIDISKEQIKSAKRGMSGKDNVETLVADALHLPFNHSLFNIVLAIEIFEHVPQPKKLAEEFHRVLKEEGKVVIVTPNDKAFFLYRCLGGYLRAAFYNYGHLHDFSSPDRFSKSLKNLNIVKIAKDESRFIPMGVLLPLLHRVLGRKVKAPQFGVRFPLSLHLYLLAEKQRTKIFQHTH